MCFPPLPPSSSTGMCLKLTLWKIPSFLQLSIQNPVAPKKLLPQTSSTTFTVRYSHLSSVTQLAHWLPCPYLSTSPIRLYLKFTFTVNAFSDSLTEVIKLSTCGILCTWYLCFSIVLIKVIIIVIILIIQNNCFKYILVAFLLLCLPHCGMFLLNFELFIIFIAVYSEKKWLDHLP